MRLRFPDPKVEAAYLAEYASIPRLRYAAVWFVVLLVTVGLGAADSRVLSAEAALVASHIRMVVALPAVALALAWALLPLRWFRAGWQVMSSAAIAGALGAVTLTSLTLQQRGQHLDDGAVHYALAILLVGTLGAYTVLLLRVGYGMSATVPCSIAWLMVRTDVRPSLIEYAAFWLVSANALGFAGGYLVERLRRVDFLHRRELDAARERADSLLRNVLPEAIAEQLKHQPGSVAQSFPEATILFADIVGFTPLAERMTPERLVELLNRVFSAFDDLADRHGLEKIKTIGDAYMVVGGVPEPRADHVEAVARMALEMREAIAELARREDLPLRIRIGVHTGPVVAGVIGKRKFSYDLWGDAVNTASRLESHGLPGEIQISATVRERLGTTFQCEERGLVALKGKGELVTFFLRSSSEPTAA